ncbi:MAG TPA: mechanosensitive ion channel family protein [Verrucomicrobiae bacterium]|nr:mechanosensitive ion channel family protein [Verrucomicrobiae bacterium]
MSPPRDWIPWRIPRLPALILALLLPLLLWLGPPAMAATGADAAVPKPAGAELTSSTIEGLEGAAVSLTEKLEPILAAAAELPDALSQYADRLADPAQGSLGLWLTRLAISFLLALALALLLPHLLIALRRRLPRHPSANIGSRMITAFLGDLAGLIALVIIFYAAHTSWFFDRSARSELAVSLFGGLVHWRLMMLPIDVLLRPREPEARLIQAPDHHAGHMRQLATWLLGFVAFSLAGLRAMLYAGIPAPAVQLLALVIGLVNAAVALYFIHRLHDALAARPAAATGEVAGVPVAPTFLGQIWHPLTLAFILAAVVAWLLGVIFSDLAIFWSVIDTGAILLGVLILQSVAAAWLTRSAPVGTDGTDAALAEEVKRAHRHLLIRRCLGVALWIAAAVLAIEIWMARLAHILPEAQWQAARGSVVSAAVTLYIAYVLWQIVFLHTAHRVPVPQQPTSEGSIGPTPIATRLQTMMPVLRIFMLVTIALVAVLIALSNLGVNTTSLIAGASIFGLAISFGSQSLVHDIVSGIFFMADDAFRIGEYIDTGKAKGTVEGMTVRSLRMRHQNGQIHVIPFGQIQQVTNFSRDWTTMKFNLRLALDTDVEKVRKIVKQIGVDMMKDPVLAAEMYQPLKMQGVTEIDSNGLVVRLKFTTKPAQPTFVYREALKRIYKAFNEKGIQFANNSVMVQTRAEPATPEDAAKLAALGAAASIAAAPSAAAD